MVFHKSFQSADLVIKKHCEILILNIVFFFACHFAYIVIHVYILFFIVEGGSPHSKTILQETVKTAQTNF